MCHKRLTVSFFLYWVLKKRHLCLNFLLLSHKWSSIRLHFSNLGVGSTQKRLFNESQLSSEVLSFRGPNIMGPGSNVMESQIIWQFFGRNLFEFQSGRTMQMLSVWGSGDMRPATPFCPRWTHSTGGGRETSSPPTKLFFRHFELNQPEMRKIKSYSTSFVS